MQISQNYSKAILSRSFVTVVALWMLSSSYSIAQQQHGGLNSQDILEWASIEGNQFWGDIFRLKYGLAPEIVNPIPGIQQMPEKVGESWHYDLRAELQSDAKETISMLDQAGLLIYDPFLQDYLNQLFLEVAPNDLPPGRSGNLSVLVYLDSEPNASAFPDGTILLNAGLVATLRTENELRAVLAHEIAHVVLDHSIEYLVVKKENEERAERRARMRAALAGVVTTAAATVGALGTGADMLDAALLGATVGVAAGAFTAENAFSQIGQMITEAGVIYSRQQEAEADNVATEWLKDTGHDSAIFASALSRISAVERYSSTAYYKAASATHPSMQERIGTILGGETVWHRNPAGEIEFNLDLASVDFSILDSYLEMKDKHYDQSIARLLYSAAQVSAEVYRDYSQSRIFIERLLETPTQSSMTLLLASKVARSTTRGEKGTLEAQAFLSKAKVVAEDETWQLLIEEAIISRRLGDNGLAISALKKIMDIPIKERPFSDQWLNDHIERLK